MAVKLLFLLAYLIAQVSCGQNSLTFVIDQSASMGDEINQVKNAAKSIVDIILKEKSSQIEDIVLVTFRNHEDSRLQNVKLKIKTRDDTQLKRALDSIDIKTAWCDEVTLAGIKRGLEESRQGSYMFVFTDTTAADYNMLSDVRTLCQEKQIQILIILTGIDCGQESGQGYKVYFDVARACNGQVFRINKNEVNQVLEFVKLTISGDRNEIITQTVPPNTWKDVNFNFDDQTEYATVQASGSTVELHIYKLGSWYEIPGTHITWTPNVKVTKLANLQPGTYRARVKGDSEVTIKIFGRTDFQFQHGFSTAVQTNLKATDVQPTTAVETLLMVSVQDKTHSALIRKVELLDMQDRVVKTLPLTHVEGNVYKTGMFLSPEQTFKITVVAESKTTRSKITRYAKTPVTPIPSVAPVISKTETIIKVKEDASVNVNCRIIGGKPRPRISWYVKKQGAALFTSLQGTDDVYHVTKASTNDKYKCVAKNVRGQDEHIITLDIQTRPKFQDTPKTIITNAGEPADIECKLQKGNPSPKITWYLKLRDTTAFTKMSYEGEIWHITATQLSRSGEYKCIANNQEGNDEKITKLIVKAKPTIENPRSKQSAMENTTLSLPCRVQGFPKPTVNWFYKGPHSAKFETISRNSENLLLNHIQLNNAGQYKCVAENEMGTTENIVEVTVNAPPRIVFIPPNSPGYFGVEGDVAMRLTCITMGYPIPTITWEVDNHVVTTDQSKELYVKNNELFLLNPKEDHSTADNSHTYVCRAKNNFGEATQPYQVYISKYADSGNVNGTTYGPVELPYDFTCPLPFTDPNSVRWFKNNTYYMTGPSLHFEHPTEGDSGNYTCRVSDLNNAASHTVEVVFGVPPKRDRTSYKVKWSGERKTIACYSNESPLGKYEWLYNGQKIEGVHTQSLLPIGWGQYTCQITHPLGNLALNFQVTTKEKACGIPISFLKTEHAPLILDVSKEWPALLISGQYMIVPHNEKIQLICQDEKSSPSNSFTKFPTAKAIYATCDKEDSFLVDGVSHKISELNCKNSVSSSDVKTGKVCLGENTELVQIGFHVNNGFTEVFQSCIDNIRQIPLYTKMNTIAVKKEPTTKMMKSACVNKCCYEKIQLVNTADVSFGPAEKATFVDTLNSVYYCKDNNNNWHEIEQITRERAERELLTVWSGAANYTKVGEIWTPKYLWKVIKPHGGSEKMVVIQENTETVGPKLCTGTCGEEVIWFEPAGDRTYCCSVVDLQKSFGVALDFN